MENSSIKLIIADDHILFIDGLKSLLQENRFMCVQEIANNGKELLDILKKCSADIVLLDINMPKLNGIEAIRLISQSYPNIKIIVLSTYNEVHLIEKAKELGAKAYLLKNCSKTELIETICSVHKGDTFFPLLTSRADDQFHQFDDFLKAFSLTKREIEIIQLIKSHMTNQQIAEKLFLSIYTVETHRKNIMHKLSLKQPTELIKFILEKNL